MQKSILKNNNMKNKESIKATANQKDRTFTLRKYVDGKLFTKYRTIKLNQEEFNSCEGNTDEDWKQFFKTDAYYKA
jgi:hypothetical protein